MIEEKSYFIELGQEIRLHRDAQDLSQQNVADTVGIDRQIISHLENGNRLPEKQTVKKICALLNVPPSKWEIFFEETFQKRHKFENLLSELVGTPVSAYKLDKITRVALEKSIDSLIPSTLSVSNSYDAFNTVLIYYGHSPVSLPFFEYYLKEALTDFEHLELAISRFQKDAIRLFSTFAEAFIKFNVGSRKDFDALHNPLSENDIDVNKERSEWNKIDEIPNADLPLLGYIAASKVKQEENRRGELSDFLRKVASELRSGSMANHSTAKKRRMDSFLREFESKLEHTFSSPLFLTNTDPEILEREADRVAPKAEEIERMEAIQARAYSNLCHYLASDYLDVYVATSMRGKADFVSVNDFVQTLFSDSQIKALKLRYFNPTQSWIEDRVAKGLVEALMLKRADICIYMAQKSDTFGKDSEASVTLGQGKSVIVYVPKLADVETGIDTETLFCLSRSELLTQLKKLDSEDADESEDIEALIGRILKLTLSNCAESDLVRITLSHWADFDLEGEFEERTKNNTEVLKVEPEILKNLLSWLKSITTTNNSAKIPISESMKEIIVQSLVGAALRFEGRAKVFREIHPLALQIILSNRVLNGILVARSAQSCAKLVDQIVRNTLQTELINEPQNYKLIEKSTQSIIRVISKHKLIANAFDIFYKS